MHVTGYSGGTLFWYRNTRDGSALPYTPRIEVAFASVFSAMSTVDWNGDGWLDIVVAVRASGSNSMLSLV